MIVPRLTLPGGLAAAAAGLWPAAGAVLPMAFVRGLMFVARDATGPRGRATEGESGRTFRGRRDAVFAGGDERRERPVHFPNNPCTTLRESFTARLPSDS
ncbi:MAG: hypothetical protein C0502_09025 [Opitutus sp.]|nr:hypothetical protein [Opitutus sp.]